MPLPSVPLWLWLVLGAGVALALVSLGTTLWLLARRRGAGDAPSASGAAASIAVGTVASRVDSRTIDELIAAHDGARLEPELRAAAAALRAAGCHPVNPRIGDPIDPAVHQVVATQPGGAGPPVVAEVIRLGWADAHGLLRPADVTARIP